MRDVTFAGAPRSDSLSLEIDSLLYRSRPEHSFDDKLRTILRERRAFFSAFGIVMALGVSYLVLAPREYVGEATVMAAPRNADLARTDSVFNPTAAPDPAVPRDPDIEGEIQILSSPAAIRRIVQQVHLDQPRPGQEADTISLSDILLSLRRTIGVDNAAGGPDLLTELKLWFSAKLGLAHPGKPSPVDAERETSSAMEKLERKLKVAPVGRSTMINIQYASPDPRLAALVATTAAQNYINTRFKERLDAAAQAADFLRGRTATLRQEVIDAEQRLAAFRATVQSQGRNPAQLQDEMRVLGERIVTARADQEKAISRLAAAKEKVATDGPLSLLNWDNGHGPDEYLAQERAIADMRKEAAKLSAVQGPFSSAVGKLDAEAQSLERRLLVGAQSRLTNLQMSAEASKREVAALESSMLAMRAEYDRMDAAATQLSAYENKAAAARTVYQNFATRLAITEQAGFNEAQGWLISAASVPTMPAKPSIPLVLIGTLVAAIGTGVFRALWVDYRGSQTVRNSDDVERHLHGARFLGLLPQLRPRHVRVRDMVAAAYSGINPEFTEAARNLYASLQRVVDRPSGSAGARIVAISSALPLEGKSGTTGAIAAAAAATGARVLVIDCDLRNPVLHTAMGVELSPGLAETIESEFPIRQAIQVHRTTGISILPAGKPNQLPQKVLQSPRLGFLLNNLRSEFDLILIDTTPILGLSDTNAVAKLCDHTVLAIRWGHTAWRAAKLALRTLADADGTAVGVVMTQVNVDKLVKFKAPEAEHYRSDYRHYYKNYYNTNQQVARDRISGPSA